MKKGFTLIELLAVIVILAIILVVAVPKIFEAIKESKDNIYISNEKMMVQATRIYTVNNIDSVPTNIGDTSVIYIDDLQDQKLLKAIKDPEDKATDCEGYILVKKEDSSNYEYTPYLKCGNNYKTTGHLDPGLTSVEVLVVAGGGGGGYRHAAGGGAGGLIFNASYSVSGSIGVTVGTGGIGSVSGSVRPTNGQNSLFGNLIAIGGGGAGQWDGGFTVGLVGGSGGGSVSLNNTGGTAGQGNAGGAAATNVASPYNHGGGGGAGAPGGNGTMDSHGSGGAGLYYGDKFGNTIGHNGWFAGGGGGGGHDPKATYRGLGGIGGGGNGGTPGIIENGEDGITNTGGGGGGASTSASGTGKGGNGGSGIVIVRYLGNQKAYGGEISSFNGYTIHTFISGSDYFLAI